MNNFVEADILVTCASLGSEIKGVYEKGCDCLECLRTVLRYLRKDDGNHTILRFLGSIRLVQTDLLPILKRYPHDKDIFDFALRLLVALTSPAILLFNDEIPDDRVSHNNYLQLISYLQTYKIAFFDEGIWQVLEQYAANLMDQAPIERSEEEKLNLERILILSRNILHIPMDEVTSIQTDDALSPQDKILWNLYNSKLDVVFLYMCCSEPEHEFCLHLLEIVSLMFREHSADSLASANEQRSTTEKEQDMKTLMAVRQREQSIKQKKIQAMVSARFSGVYCVKDMKSIGENDYISHKLITDASDVKFDISKNAKRTPKNKVAVKEVDTTRRSTLATRVMLKSFCKEFLKGYNRLIYSVKRELLRKSSEDHDDTYYLWTMQYFMKFNRLYDFEVAYVSETISIQMFHQIQTQITNYHEMMQTDKKKAHIWSKRMRMGVSAYKELLHNVYVLTKSSEENLRRSADVLVSNVFYVIEYREMLLSLLSNFDETKFSIVYLSELVEGAYLFLKMLENHSKRFSEVIVQKKKRKVGRRKKKKPVKKNVAVDLDEEWSNIAGELSAAVQNRREIPSDLTPFDGASEIPFEEQKVSAVYKIRSALLTKEAEQAVGLLRTARELWPEGDSFGSADIDSEDEFGVLREIFLSNLQDPNAQVIPTEDDDNSHDEESDEEMLAVPAVTEQKLDLKEVYQKYASRKVVMACCALFNNYEMNSTQTNLCLVKLLHRIAWDCKMHALFFQASLFCTFQKLFNDPDVSYNPVTKELYRFAKFIVSKFFEVAQKNEKVFVELLFWKNASEAHELEMGYENSFSNSKIRGAWTEEEEEELTYLYEENKDIHIEGQDVADIILANIGQAKRTKKQIILQLRRLNLITSVRDLKPHLRAEWQEAEVMELKHLFEDHQTSDDIMGNILGGLSIKRSRKAVVDKMLELNLIQDSKEVRKKQSKKSKKGNGGGSGSDSDDKSGLDDRVENMPTNYHSESDNEDDEAFFERMKAERLRDQNVNNSPDTEMNTNQENISSNQSKKPTRPSKTWDEQEIVELNHLFNENKDADDVMNVILSSLTVKRSKQNVVEKLLEVGLIKDKKEIKKKRKNKFLLENTLNDNMDTGHGSEGDEDDHRTHSPSLIDKKKKRNRILSDSSDEDTAGNSIENGTGVHISEKENSLKKKQQMALTGEKVKKRLPKEWDEQEMVQLQQLFNEHKNTDDIIGNIVNNLSVKRAKEKIIEKLLEVGLINDRKEIRKKRKTKERNANKSDVSDNETVPLQKLVEIGTKATVKKRPPKVWAEQEIVELNELFQKHKGSADVIGALINGLSVKRSKENIIEKLLEVALIKDRKEIRKRKDKTANINDKDEDNQHARSKGKSKVKKTTPNSSEDEMPLNKILNQSTNSTHNGNDNKNKTDTSDDELTFNNIRAENKYGNDSRKKNKILSDSEDDETLPLQKQISITSAKGGNMDKGAITEPVPSSSHELFQDETMQLSNEQSPISSLGSKVTRTDENLQSSGVGSGQKRKRPRIEDSDDSNDESPLLGSISKNSITSTMDENKMNEHEVDLDNLDDVPDTETANFPLKKKRARVLMDSDESD